MLIPFSKMHGIGNDYVYVNGFQTHIPDPAKFSVFISDRHFGIGSDGLILILPSETADFKMRMYNADGSEGAMCGNATRCIGKYVYDNRMTDKTSITLETRSGIKYLDLTVRDGRVTDVTVDMGKAILEPAKIPVKSDLDRFVDQEILVDGQPWRVTAVSMGNPHAVTFCKEVDSLELEKIGPAFEHHPLFPDRVNTEFVRVISPTEIQMRVWERGSGETFACGTGACASVVASVENGLCRRGERVTVHLRGGDLGITYRMDGTVLMQGPATHVFDGEIEFDF